MLSVGQQCSKCLACVISLISHNNPKREVLILWRGRLLELTHIWISSLSRYLGG